MSLGRYQKGHTVVLGFAVTDADGLPTLPDVAPVATVRDPGGNSLSTLEMYFTGRPWDFQFRLFLDVNFAPLGTYSVSYSVPYGEGTATATGSDTFHVIAGGDEGGAVISMFGIDRPEARYVVAQLASGRLVQGRNPKL